MEESGMRSVGEILSSTMGRLRPSEAREAFQAMANKAPWNTAEEYVAMRRELTPALAASDEANGIVCYARNGVVYFAMDAERFARENRGPVPCEMPPERRNRGFDSFLVDCYSPACRVAARRALDVSKRYVQNFEEIMRQFPGKGLYFSGRTRGSGKTLLGSIVGWELFQTKHGILWLSMPDLLMRIKSTYDRDSGTSEADILRKCQSAQILILDDVGAQRQSAWVDEVIFQIVDRRVAQRRPTIFTSNVPPLDLDCDERIVSRIASSVYPVEMPEESVRQRIAALEQREMRRMVETGMEGD